MWVIVTAVLNPTTLLRPFVGLVCIVAVTAACTSSDGDSALSEDDAEERIAAVLDVFEEAAGEAGFQVDDDDDDDDNRLECDGFEAFEATDDTIADDELSVTDGNEPEPALEDGLLVFSGGAVTGTVDVGVLENDELEAALDSVLADVDSFADCIRDGLSGEDDDLSRVFDGDVTVEEGDTGDQEIVVTFEGQVTGDTQGYDYVLDIGGQARFVRVGTAGVVATTTLSGDADRSAIDSAIDAAVDEFIDQFG